MLDIFVYGILWRSGRKTTPETDFMTRYSMHRPSNTRNFRGIELSNDSKKKRSMSWEFQGVNEVNMGKLANKSKVM